MPQEQERGPWNNYQPTGEHGPWETYSQKPDLTAQDTAIDKMQSESADTGLERFARSFVGSTPLGLIPERPSSIGGALKTGAIMGADPLGIGRSAIGLAKQIPGAMQYYGERLNPVGISQGGIGKIGEDIKSVAPELGGMVAGGLATAAAVPAGEMLGKIPRTGRAAMNFQDVMSRAKDIPIDLSKVSDSALRIKDMADRGEAMPMSVSKFLRRATAPDSPPITYEEARDFYSPVSKLSANENMRLSDRMKQAVGQFRTDLNSSLQDAATQVGKGPQYGSAMKEYAGAKNINKLKGMAWTAAKQSVPWLARGALVGAGGTLAYRALKDLP